MHPLVGISHASTTFLQLNHGFPRSTPTTLFSPPHTPYLGHRTVPLLTYFDHKQASVLLAGCSPVPLLQWFAAFVHSLSFPYCPSHHFSAQLKYEFFHLIIFHYFTSVYF